MVYTPKCPLFWIAVVALAALAAGYDKVYVTGTTLVVTAALLAYVGVHYHIWVGCGCAVLTFVFAASTLFYALHCKPLADARRKNEKVS